MEEILMTLLKLIIMVVVPVATSALTYFMKKFLDMKIDSLVQGKTAEDLKKGVDIIADSVNYVQQTYVDALKKEDKFDKDAQENAFLAARDRAIDLMNNDVLNAIEKSYGNIDEYIVTIIESLIKKSK